ncbi:MAG: cation:proton antiporter [Stellaceae bacterium]
MGVAVGVLCIALGGVAAQWISWRFRMPAIVLLFATGLFFGPGLQILDPGRQFGPGLRPIVDLAVAIVVFEGGLTLDIRELRAAGGGVLRLTTLAAAVTWLLGTVAAHAITGMSWAAAILFGAIVIVTGPTVVLPLLRQTRLQPRPASLLKWEAIVNDPIGAVLAAIVLQVLLARAASVQVPAAGTVLHLLGGFVAAVALGGGCAVLASQAFIRDQVPESLKSPLLIALALSVYVVANLVTPQAGLVAATLFGVTLGNLNFPGLSELKRFKEALVILIVSALFVVLTAELDRATLSQLSWRMIGLVAAMLFVVRPASVLLATTGSGIPLAERALVAWMAPRGVVAAAVAGLAGGALNGAGYGGGLLVMPAVFALIAASVVLHGFTLRPAARALGLNLGDTPGLAIIGASAWSTDMATVLHQAGVSVLLVDTFPGALAEARGKGIPVLQAEVLSEHGEEALSTRRVDYSFAATPDAVYNALVCVRLAPELGRERVLQLPQESRRPQRRTAIGRESRGKVIGRPLTDYDAFEERFEAGWRFAVIAQDEAAPAIADAIELAVVDDGGALAFTSVEAVEPLVPGLGGRTLVFAPPSSGTALEAAS